MSEEQVQEVVEESSAAEVTEAEVNEPTTETEEIAVEQEVDPVAELTAQNEALSDQLLRLQAELQNMRRIHTREKQDAAKYRSQSLASQLLDVADNLERALATEATSEDAKALHKGVEMVQSQLLQAFEKEQIQVIDPAGQAFDPNFHQAVSVMPAPNGEASDTVLHVLQKGYQLADRVLRPAMVIVSE